MVEENKSLPARSGAPDFAALERRLADRAPAMVCESLRTGARTIVPVAHIAERPASRDELDRLHALLRGHAPDLPRLWARWNGLRLCVEVDAIESNHLLALHPIDHMEGGAEDLGPWLEDRTGDPDLAGVVVIGAPATSADCLIVPTTGPHAGRIARFDHETLRIEPFARDVAELVALVAGDPIALIEPLGSTTRYALDRDQLLPVQYLADRAGSSAVR